MVPFFEEIHIENTNSCGYKCRMCPRESQTRQIGFMSLEDFSFVLERIQPVQWIGSHQGVFHLHGFGEPLLDRRLIQKIEVLQKKYPSSSSLIFSTLGVSVKEDYFVKLLEAGLSTMIISLYGFIADDYKKIHGYDGLECVKQNLQSLSRAMQLFPNLFRAIIKIPGHALTSSLPVAEPPEKITFCQWAKELGFNLANWNYVHNYSSGRHYNMPNTERMCPVVNGKRKNILNITWDLNVIPCCYDFNATIQFGNLRQQSLEEIFLGPEYLAFIIAHQSADLAAYRICQNCEKNDYT